MLLAAGAPALPNVPTSLAAKVNTARLHLGGPLYTQRAFLIESLFRHNVLAFGAAVRTGAHDATYALATAACFGSPAQLQVGAALLMNPAVVVSLCSDASPLRGVWGTAPPAPA